MARKRPTIAGPGKSKRRHPNPEGHVPKMHKSKTWINHDKPKLEPLTMKGVQVGVITLGENLTKEHAQNYIPDGDYELKNKDDYIEIWTKPEEQKK